ncbi:MAG: arsinothricin resistance N-acetyltransferase ArsN1 family A [Thermomicrobiales bacterium]
MSRPDAGQIVIRPAVPGDAADIARIYNQGIRTRNATFETEERTGAEREVWLASHDDRHPVLVAVVGGGVAGWASVDGYRSRACYAGVAEFSIYIDEAVRGQGVGIVLLNALIDVSEQVGLWKLLSRVFVENTASRALCSKAGFREVGIYEKHAQLDGIWRDCVIVERLIPANIT